MVAKRIIYIIPVLSILNSSYLSFVYLEAFMLNKINQELISNLGLILMASFLTIAIVITIFNLTKKGKKINLSVTDYFTEKILPIIFILICMPFIYNGLKSDYYYGLSVYGIAILGEIMSVTFAIGKNRERALMRSIEIVFLWLFVGSGCFSITGIFEQYLGYKELEDSDIRLVFTAVFYHLLNACFLLYSYLPKEITQNAL